MAFTDLRKHLAMLCKILWKLSSLSRFLSGAAKAALKQEQEKRLAEQQRLKASAAACKPLSRGRCFAFCFHGGSRRGRGRRSKS